VQLWWQQLLFIFSFRVLVKKISASEMASPGNDAKYHKKYYFELDLY